MERKTPFEVGEYYHAYTRGVEKRVVFSSTADKERFMTLLLTCNDEAGVKLSNLTAVKREFTSLVAKKRTNIVHIVAYTLMPNHIHLILREVVPNGISKFMLKLMTGYAMYFNTRYERSGPLFTRPFRSKHIDTDEYFRWAFAYVHLNPLNLRSGAEDTSLTDASQRFLQSYEYSSLRDYYGAPRSETAIINPSALPFLADLHHIDELLTGAAMFSPEELGYESFFSPALV